MTRTIAPDATMFAANASGTIEERWSLRRTFSFVMLSSVSLWGGIFGLASIMV